MFNKKTITIQLDEYNRLLESQKQVDELKEKSKKVNDLVKDTAKEICLKIIKGQPQPIQEKWVEWFKKEYGVEVE